MTWRIPMLLPGIKISTSHTDHRPIKAMQLAELGRQDVGTLRRPDRGRQRLIAAGGGAAAPCYNFCRRRGRGGPPGDPCEMAPACIVLGFGNRRCSRACADDARPCGTLLSPLRTVRTEHIILSGPARGPRSPVKLSDVAAEAGVAPMTVSRVINTPDRVSAHTAARVRAAIEKLGYVPNLVAGGLSSRRSRMVAAILPTIAHAMFAELVQTFTERCAVAATRSCWRSAATTRRPRPNWCAGCLAAAPTRC